YDLELVWSDATSFAYWNAVPPVPYTAYGILKVVHGEFGGTVGPDQCAQIRVYSCPVGSLTAAGPQPTPKFALHDAFPNPFSGATTMGFVLDEAAHVTVQVYDVAGRRVADVMKSRSMPKGSGSFSIEASNLSSGVYFVKMSTPAKSVTRKIVILR
ncbi:MAG TPA: T9SS type A sorting domain-containing protein, partial [Candidatus Krumholzibacteria bacterium]|nr:T9SS type A sorting domain-containing protein [Candidatus Krumholzibacteria bacterium]